MLAAAFFFSLMSLFVKLAGRRLPSAEIVFARSVVSLVLSYALLRRARLSPWGHNKSMLILRGSAGFVALLCFFFAVTRLPLADATIIHFTNPVFTGMLAAVFLGEAMRRRELGGLALSLAGVVLVAQPTFLFGESARGLDGLGVGLGLLGAVCSSVAYIAVRKLRESDHLLVVIFWFPLIATPASIPLMAKHAMWPTPAEWILLVGIGIVTHIAQMFLTKGLHLERAGRAMSLSYVQILFAATWGALFFNDLPNGIAVVGAALVVSGALLTSRIRPVMGGSRVR